MLRVSIAFILATGTACAVDQVELFPDSGRVLTAADGGDAAVHDEGIEPDGGDAFVPDEGVEPDGGDASVPDEGVADLGVPDSGREPCVCRRLACSSVDDCRSSIDMSSICDARRMCTGSIGTCDLTTPCSSPELICTVAADSTDPCP